MRELRVLHISPTYFSPESVLGGGERYVGGLVKAMSSAVPTTFLSFGAHEREEMKGKLRFRILKPWFNLHGNILDPVSLSFLSEIAQSDIVHCHQVNTIVTEAALVAGALMRKKVFLTDHGGGGRTFLRRLGVRRLATGILAVSQYSLSKLNPPSGKGKVIYGGIDTNFFRPRSEFARVSGRMVAVGRLLPHKGFHHLIDVFSEGELIIAGGSADEGYLKELKRRALGKNVRFAENVSDEEIVGLLNSAELAVFPSTRLGMDGKKITGEPELFGQAPLEAMACGAPALVSDVGSYPEIALPEHPELIFGDGDVDTLRRHVQLIRKEIRNTDIQKALGEQARAHVLKNFTWDRTVARCLEAYQLKR